MAMSVWLTEGKRSSMLQEREEKKGKLPLFFAFFSICGFFFLLEKIKCRNPTLKEV
jgi:hypothetical protein